MNIVKTVNKTIQQILKEVDLEQVYSLLGERHKETEVEEKSLEDHIKSCREGYGKTVGELLSFDSCDEPDTLVVDYIKDDFDDGYYYHISLLNPNYEAPDEGLKPFGGKWNDKSNAPEGHYNWNCDNCNETFAIDGKNRDRIAFGKFILTDAAKNITFVELVAEFLWELTFNGWTESQSNDFWEDMVERIKSADENDFIKWEDVKKEFKNDPEKI